MDINLCIYLSVCHYGHRCIFARTPLQKTGVLTVMLHYLAHHPHHPVPGPRHGVQRTPGRVGGGEVCADSVLTKECLQVDLLNVPMLGADVPDVEEGGVVVVAHVKSLALQ